MEGRTVLHVAASMGNMILTRMLLKAGADKHVQDKWGVTPKECARRLEFQGLVNLLS